jgi:hypothetical protein
MLQPFYSCSSLVLESPSFLDATPSARRLRGGRPTFLCALHSLVRSFKISTRNRLRSLPPSLAFSLSCTHASHALPLTQACPSPETPQVHTDRRQRSRWASNAESWCRGGHRQFACMSQVTTWAWLLLQVELMTRRARSGQARDGRRDSACSGHHATRRRGDIVVSRRGIDILHASRSQVTTWAWLLLLHASQM